MAFGDWPFAAVIVKVVLPTVVVAEPLIVAVPLPLSVKVTPVGNVPGGTLNDGVGDPVVVTVNAPVVPTVIDPLAALVMAGGVTSTTFSVKGCCTLETTLLAVIVMG